MFSIYKITNTINGKVYIGLTGMGVDRRWKYHLKSAKAGKTAIAQAIRCYGKEHFSVEEIFVAFSQLDAAFIEKQLILEFKSVAGGGGYNIRLGGQLGLLPEHCKRGELHYKQKLTEQHVINIRQNEAETDRQQAERLTIELGTPVSKTAVYFARTGRSWRHLNDRYKPLQLNGKRRHGGHKWSPAQHANFRKTMTPRWAGMR